MIKKVFISYSWGTKEHQEWVINLSKRLMNDTVDVVLDKWSLKEGNDVYHFMESMVKAEDIYRVLVICDKNYKNKSDNRDGGVGTETQIITPEIYKNQKQEKFIPLVIERDENDIPLLPIYLSSRKYIDFSKDEYFEDSYEELLRNILDAPSIPKPKLGDKVPLYITESAVNNTKTNSIVRTLDNQLKKNPEKINSYSHTFIDAFLESLWDFEFKSSSHNLDIYGKEILENLRSYKILREDFIVFLNKVTLPEYNLDVEILIGFYEKKNKYNKSRDGTISSSRFNYENFSFIFQELFIYTIAICLRNKNYKLVEDLLYSKFYFYDEYLGRTKPMRYTEIYNHLESIENYCLQTFKKISGFGHLITTNLSESITKEELVFADILCHYIADLYPTPDFRDSWFPRTYLYMNRYSGYDFFERLSSERHLKKVLPLFEVNSKEDLQKLLKDYKERKKEDNRLRYLEAHDALPFLYEVINIETLGVNR